MLNKFGSDVRFPLTAAFSLSAVMAAMVAVAPAAQAQVPCVAVPKDPNAAPGTASAGTPSATCSQYFAGGATFPLLLNRALFNHYGISIPTGTAILPGQRGATGFQPSSPVGSPRNTGVQINYCGTGSGNGRAIFTGVGGLGTSASCSFANSATFTLTPTGADPLGQTAVATGAQVSPFPTNTAGTRPLFAGTDVPLSTTDQTAYTTNIATRGNPIQVPTAFGMIAAAYNPAVILGGLTGGLSLTTSDLCRIFDGTYFTYALVTGTVPAGTIRVFVRSDPSETTKRFTSYLGTACPPVVGPYFLPTGGVDVFPFVVGFTYVNSNDLMTDHIAGTTGGIGYIDSTSGQPYSATTISGIPAPFLASLQNPLPSHSFFFPTVTNLNRGLTAVTLAANPDYPCVLSVSGLPVVPTANNAYPIILPTYTLGYTQYPTIAENNAFRSVFNFVLTNRTFPFPQANDQIAQGLSFAVLNNNSAAPFAATNNLRKAARTCVLGAPTITSPTGLTVPSAGGTLTLRHNGYVVQQGIYNGVTAVTVNGVIYTVVGNNTPNAGVLGTANRTTNTTLDINVLPLPAGTYPVVVTVADPNAASGSRTLNYTLTV
jgi:ABC-type phosphate transport system substrate-binding protein